MTEVMVLVVAWSSRPTGSAMVAAAGPRTLTRIWCRPFSVGVKYPM
jgi:hypothetical protein